MKMNKVLYVFFILLGFFSNISFSQEKKDTSKFYLSDEFIRTLYLIEVGEEEPELPNHICLKLYNSFEDDVILKVNNDILYEGTLYKNTGHKFALFMIDKRNYNDFILFQYYSKRYNTKIEVALDTRYGSTSIDIGMGEHLPPEDWEGPYPIKCTIVYRMSGCTSL